MDSSTECRRVSFKKEISEKLIMGEKMKKESTTNLAITAVFIAILILQTFVPNIGYIRILPALPAITTIPLTVAIYSSLLGPRYGTIFGVAWGLTRLVVAYTQPGDMVSLLLFRNPVTSLVPSVLAGLVPGLIESHFKNKSKRSQKFVYVINGAATSLVNTAMVIILASLFFMKAPATLTSYLGNFSAKIPLFFILIVSLGLNGLIEAVFTAAVTPIIVVPLFYIIRRI